MWHCSLFTILIVEKRPTFRVVSIVEMEVKLGQMAVIVCDLISHHPAKNFSRRKCVMMICKLKLWCAVAVCLVAVIMGNKKFSPLAENPNGPLARLVGWFVSRQVQRVRQETTHKLLPVTWGDVGGHKKIWLSLSRKISDKLKFEWRRKWSWKYVSHTEHIPFAYFALVQSLSWHEDPRLSAPEVIDREIDQFWSTLPYLIHFNKRSSHTGTPSHTTTIINNNDNDNKSNGGDLDSRIEGTFQAGRIIIHLLASYVKKSPFKVFSSYVHLVEGQSEPHVVKRSHFEFSWLRWWLECSSSRLVDWLTEWLFGRWLAWKKRWAGIQSEILCQTLGQSASIITTLLSTYVHAWMWNSRKSQFYGTAKRICLRLFQCPLLSGYFYSKCVK